jgi:hypothetical protein
LQAWSFHKNDLLHYHIDIRNYQFLFRYQLDEILSQHSIDLISQKTRFLSLEDQKFCWELFRRSSSIRQRVQLTQIAQNGFSSIPNFDMKAEQEQEQKQKQPLSWLEEREAERAIQSGSTREFLEILEYTVYGFLLFWISFLQFMFHILMQWTFFSLFWTLSKRI